MVQRVPLGAILGVLGVVWAVQGVPLGVILGVLGYPWAPLARSRLQKPFGPPLFSRFWCPKGAQEGAKMKLKSIKNRFKNRLNFLLGFGLVLDGFLVDFGGVFGTLDLQKWVCGVSDVLFYKKSHFLIRFGLGVIF